MENTTTLDKLGYREIDQLANLLKAYADNPNDCGLGEGVNWEYNPMSDNLFLIDEEYSVAMLNGDTLEKWFNCSYCGHEGFLEEYGRIRKEKDTQNEEHNYLACSECEEAGRNPEEYLIQID